MATREELRRLVTTLPEGAIDSAHANLARLQVWPPPPPPGREAALERFRQTQQRMMERQRERMEEMHEKNPGQCGIVMGGGTFAGGRGKGRGRQSFGYRDGEDSVHETTIVHDDCEFTLIERIRRDEAAREVRFVVEVTGPDATTARHEHRYPLP